MPEAAFKMESSNSLKETSSIPTEAEIIQATQTRAERVGTYGTIQHHDPVTGELLLNPKPSDDPNDPLNWSQGYKWYIAGLVCLAMMACNYLAAGPTIQIVETTFDFFPEAKMEGPTGVVNAIGKVAYFFTTTALFQGLSNLFWIPMMNKYGRRPMYLISFLIYFIAAIWAAFTFSYGSFLASRMLIGFSAGAAEGIAPVTISDCFFLHERGKVMALYTMSLSLGVAGGLVVDGLISINNPWRVDYYVTIALIGAILVLIFFTFPETAFKRRYAGTLAVPKVATDKQERSAHVQVKSEPALDSSSEQGNRPQRYSYGQRLKVFNGTYTEESVLVMMLRPLILILLPQGLWASLVMAVTIGFLVAITSNVAPAFGVTYGFAAWQIGLCFISSMVGSGIGIIFGGHFSDMVADYFTRRNNGVREPEFRLPAIAVSLVTAPLALILYGFGIQNQWHWIVPTIGLGLLNFSIVQATNVSLVYTIDSYRPIAGEITVTQLAFKSAFGFLLSFYTNPWVAESGYANAYGAMAGISAAVLLMSAPLYIYGKRIRRSTAEWKIMRFVIWHVDRDSD